MPADVPAELESLQLGDLVNQRLMTYQSLLLKWNRSYNLTAIKNPEEILHRHVLDSLTVTKFLKGNRCLDVGSGAGLPGLILAVTDVNRNWVLLDSNVKKIRFLRHALMELGLYNAEVHHGRVEEYFPETPFDTIICRAFAPLDRMLSCLGHLLINTNQLLAMKGKLVNEELQVVDRKDLMINVHPLTVFGQQESANLVQIARQVSNQTDGA